MSKKKQFLAESSSRQWVKVKQKKALWLGTMKHSNSNALEFKAPPTRGKQFQIIILILMVAWSSFSNAAIMRLL